MQGVTTTMRVPMIILAGLCVILGVAPQTGLSLVTPVINELMPHLGTRRGPYAGNPAVARRELARIRDPGP